MALALCKDDVAESFAFLATKTLIDRVISGLKLAVHMLREVKGEACCATVRNFIMDSCFIGFSARDHIYKTRLHVEFRFGESKSCNCLHLLMRIL